MFYKSVSLIHTVASETTGLGAGPWEAQLKSRGSQNQIQSWRKAADLSHSLAIHGLDIIITCDLKKATPLSDCKDQWWFKFYLTFFCLHMTQDWGGKSLM